MKLNKEQDQAVKQTKGAVLILAGAGSGKTRVLVARTLHILEQNLARPFECLLLTFTNKAAEEMRHRIQGAIGEGASSIWLSTFHRFGVRVLRRYAERLGYKTSFNILAESDQERLVKQVMETLKLDTKTLSPGYVIETISLLKDKALNPEQVKGQTSKEIEDIYNLYQKRMKEMNVMDFGDLLLQAFNLFQNHADVLRSYQGQFKYIMVDEYQDTNVVQYLLLRLLAQGHHNICCVGDEDQSIYSWRGAEISNILNFQKDFKDAVVIRLEQNYRSTPSILEGAGKLIAHNKARIGKELRVADGREAKDAPVRVLACLNADDEAETVLRRITELKREGHSYQEMAILVRASFQTRAFEERLIKAHIPYQILSGRKFYERQEIQDVIAYLRLLKHREDDMAFLRVINMPKRGLGDKALLSIREYATGNHISFFEATKRISFKPQQQKAVSEFLSLFGKYENPQQGISFYEQMQRFIEETGYIRHWQENKAEEAETRLDNVNELFGVMQDGFGTLEEFLEHVSLVTDQDAEKGDDRVSLMTMHAAKGLEYDAVFIPGVEEGIVPHQKSMDGGEKDIEEERRLMYVGMTRARKELMLTYAATRVVFGQFQNNLPSRFLSEIAGRKNFGQSLVPKPPVYSGYRTYKPKAAKAGFQPMDLVQHERFGVGEVVDVDGDSLDIRFDDGIKKIKTGFVKPYKEE